MARSTARARMLLSLLLATLLAAVIIPVFAQDGPPAEPLVPNIEPEEQAALQAAQAPWAAGEEQAVLAALAALAASGETTPPEGAILDLPSDAVAVSLYQTYLPLLTRADVGGQDPSQGGPVVTPTPDPATPTPRGRPADVAVTIWPKPSILVGRGGVLEYEVRLANSGPGEAREVKVVFPYNRQQVSLAYSSLSSKAGDWVSAIGPDSFTVTFGKLEAGARRTGKLFVRVGAGLPLQTLLDVRASYSWRDGDGGGAQRANWTPVLVGGGPSDAPFAWVRVQPDRGPAGTQHVFFSNRFLPGETVTTWVNLQGGKVQGLALRGVASPDGAVELRLRSGDADPDLPRGTHQIVLYGQRSGLTGVATFIVQ